MLAILYFFLLWPNCVITSDETCETGEAEPSRTSPKQTLYEKPNCVITSDETCETGEAEPSRTSPKQTLYEKPGQNEGVRSQPVFRHQRWETEYQAIDMSSPNVRPIIIGSQKYIELMDGEHFDWLLQNPLEESRTASAVLFWNSDDDRCSQEFVDLHFQYKKSLDRTNILLTIYDMYAAPLRNWYKFVPERNLKTRFNITKCPELVYIPKDCDGQTDWCIRRKPVLSDPSIGFVMEVGCENFTEHCTTVKHWNPLVDVPWMEWLSAMNRIYGTPKSPLRNARYRQFDTRTETTMTRNAFMPPAAPRFSPLGFKAVKIPAECYRLLREFYKKWYHKRHDEGPVFGVINTNLVHLFIVSLDNDIEFRQMIATRYLQPILEEWSGLDLEFASFYGIREYHKGSTLRNHVDRTDTHVISATLSLGSVDPDSEKSHWPIEVIDSRGRTLRYDHPPGTMALYESTSLIHGRPYPLSGGTHLGAFIHFYPKHWPIHAQQMRDRISSKTTRKHFAITPKLDVLNLQFEWRGTVKPDIQYFSEHVDAHELPFSVKFYNFRFDDVLMYWYDGSKMHNHGGIAAGQFSAVATYPTHVFVIKTYAGWELIRFEMCESQLIYIVPPIGNVDDHRDYQKILKFQKYCDEYKSRTGYPYLAGNIRSPTKLFMHSAHFLGQTHTVTVKNGYCSDVRCSNTESIKFKLIVVSKSPKAFLIEDVVNEFEKDHIVAMAKKRFGDSIVGQGRFAYKSSTRTSKTAWLKHTSDEVIYTVCRRIIEIMRLDPSLLHKIAEDLQIVQYKLLETYNSHYDFSFNSANDRYATFGMYLKSPIRGGHTGFPNALGGKGFKIRPPAGSAILFYNFLEDGNGDYYSAHSATPVIEGEKYFSNLWIWDPSRY